MGTLDHMSDGSTNTRVWTGSGMSPLLDTIAHALIRSSPPWFLELGWTNPDGTASIPLADDPTFSWKPGLRVGQPAPAGLLKQTIGSRCRVASELAPHHPSTLALQIFINKLARVPDDRQIGIAMVFTSDKTKGHYTVYVDLNAAELLGAIPTDLNLQGNDSPSV